MLERSAWFLELVGELVSPALDGKLLGLGARAAVVAMADGSAALIHDSEPGVATEDLGERMAGFVRENPGLNLKIVVLGGGDEVRKVLAAVQPSLGMGRVVQVFAVSDAGVVWAGARSRVDSPMGRAIEQVLARDAATNPGASALAAGIVPPTPEERVRHEDHRRFVVALHSGLPRASLAVLSAIALVFLAEAIWGGTEFIPTLVRMGANDARALTTEPWRLLSSTWLHAGMLHVVVNGFALYSLGGFVERLLGWRRFLLLYVASALGGGIASAAFAKAALSVGASGAVFGLLGTTAALAFRPNGLIPQTAVAGLRRSAIVNLLANLVISFSVPEIDVMAHVGGAIVGATLVLSGLIVRGLDRAAPNGPGERRTTIPAVLAMAISASALVVAQFRGRPWQVLSFTPTEVVRIDELGVELDAPANLAPARRIEAGAFQIGSQLDDAGMLIVAVHDHGLELAEAGDRRAYREQIAANLPVDDEDVTSLAVRADADLGGRDVVEWRYRIGDTIEVARWDWVETHERITIEAAWWAGHPEVAPVLREAAASLRPAP